MRLIDLLVAIGSDTDTKSNIKIQICHPGRNRKSYDTFNADSKLLEPFCDLEIRYLSAIETNVVRVDLAFDKEEGCDLMSRLIDADKLKHVIHCAYSDDLEIIEKIDEQPTAYDLDKVVEELEKELKLADDEKERCSRENQLQFDCAKGYAHGIAVAIEIVKGGGVE